MSIRSAVAAFAALMIAAPMTARGQEMEADFVKARQQFVAGQTRQAAQTLIVSSLAVRQQLGRCRDDDVGTGLVEAEGKLEKLAAAIRAGSVSGVKSLDQSLVQIDRLLARHHLQLAISGSTRPRAGDVAVAAKDLDRSTFHFERSITLHGTALSADQAKVIGDARAVAKEMNDTDAVPPRAKEVMSALDKALTAVTSVSTNGR